MACLRKRRGLVAAALLLASMVSSKVTAAAAAETEQLPLQRIVSLSPHLTEAVYWLGAGESLKGRDRFSNFPEEAEAVAVVGDAYSLNIEALLALQPDLVLLWQAPESLQRQIRQFGIPVFNSQPQTVDEIRAELVQLAELLAVRPAQQFAKLDQHIAKLKNKAAKQQPRKALLLVQSQPPVALGNQDVLAASLPYCGWQNVFQQPQAVINVSPEFLPSGDYDAVISFTQRQNAHLKSVPYLKPTADPLLRPGPRFAPAMTQLCQQLADGIKP